MTFWTLNLKVTAIDPRLDILVITSRNGKRIFLTVVSLQLNDILSCCFCSICGIVRQQEESKPRPHIGTALAYLLFIIEMFF